MVVSSWRMQSMMAWLRLPSLTIARRGLGGADCSARQRGPPAYLATVRQLLFSCLLCLARFLRFSV